MDENENIKKENKEAMEKYSLLQVTNDEAIIEDDDYIDIDDRCCRQLMNINKKKGMIN